MLYYAPQVHTLQPRRDPGGGAQGGVRGAVGPFVQTKIKQKMHKY